MALEERWDRSVPASDEATMERRDDFRLRAGRLLVGSVSSLLNISNLCKFSLESLSLEGRSSWGSSERCTPSGSSALATKSSCKLSSESSCLEGGVLRGRFEGRTSSRCSGLAVESRERFRSLLVDRGWGGGRRGSSKWHIFRLVSFNYRVFLQVLSEPVFGGGSSSGLF